MARSRRAPKAGPAASVLLKLSRLYPPLSKIDAPLLEWGGEG